jgi:hypothetical protein
MIDRAGVTIQAQQSVRVTIYMRGESGGPTSSVKKFQGLPITGFKA